MMLFVGASIFAPAAKAQNWTGTTISAAKNQTVYLWNVGAKQFLGKGGKWGTEAIVSNVGTPFKVVSSGSNYLLQSVVKGQGSTNPGYLGFMNGVNSTHDNGNYFVDRSNSGNDEETTTFAFVGTTASEGYLLEVTSTNGTSDYQGTFYLFANMKGNKKAKGVKNVPTDSTDYSKWVIVTEQERKDIFEKAEASKSAAVPATFLMFDNGFDRNDNNITNWKTKSSAAATDFDGTLSWEKNKSVKPSDAYPSTKTTTTYTYTYTGKHTYYYRNTSYTHNITYTVTTTTAPQDQPTTLTISCDKSTTKADYSHTTQNVTVTLDESQTTSKEEIETSAGYTYYVGNGYVDDNTTLIDEDGKELSEKTHEQELYGGDWTANIHGSYGVVNQTIPNANMIREGWYKVSCVGFTTATQGSAQLYASAGTGADASTKYYAVQKLKAISSANVPATYAKASKLINNGGYEASVMVYIDNNTSNQLKTLSFGILVDNAESSAWTCFDDFQIEYLGKPTEVLVLDETQTSVDYINAQTANSMEDNAKRTLYLHRTINANKWNSIVLPVSLTVSQAQSAFGDNFKLSEFKGAINKEHPDRMYFEAVNINRNNKDAVAIKAGKLYIMKPTEEEPTNQAEISFPEATNISGKLTCYFTIVGVTFNDELKTFNAKVKGETGDETFDSNTKVQFVGTYTADANGKQMSPANSYVLRGNKDDEAGLWFYRTIPTATKGFRGWLETTTTNGAKISFSINGVIDDSETTSINDMNTEKIFNDVQGNIYNLSGQLIRSNATSLEGLAKGIYIHNGKKIIIK